MLSVTSNQNKALASSEMVQTFKDSPGAINNTICYLNNSTKEKALLRFLGNTTRGGLQRKVNILLS
jgi:hypothetical protein